MAFGIKLTKEDMLKIFALFIVGAFILEAFALAPNFLSPHENVNGEGNVTVDTFEGAGQATATLLSWDPALIVVGDNPQIDEVVRELKSDGIVTYSSTSTGTLVLNLARSTDLARAAERIMELENVSLFADARIGLTNITVSGQGFSKEVPPTSFRYRTTPIFDIGDEFPVSFSAHVSNGQLQQVGNLMIGAGKRETALLEPINVSEHESYFVMQIPWEMRNSVDARRLQETLGKGFNVTYKLKSYIDFDPPITSQQIQQYSAILPPYMIGINQQRISIQREFTNKSRVESDLDALGIGAMAKFPQSILSITPVGNKNISESSLQEAFSESFPNISFNPLATKLQELKVTLPEKIGVGGKNYMLSNSTVFMQGDIAKVAGMKVLVSFTPIGKRIPKLDRVEWVNAANGTTENPA